MITKKYLESNYQSLRAFSAKKKKKTDSADTTCY